MTFSELIILYSALAAVEVYFFLMQRSALELSRAHNIDPAVGRELLPLWYLSVWPIKIGRWVLLYLIWRQAGLVAAVSAWVLVLIATTFLPVPHAHFRPMFRRRVSQNMLTPLGQNAPTLMVALLQDEHNVESHDASRRDV